MLINSRKKGCSGIIPFVYEGKEEIHKYAQYMGRTTNQRKVPKWLPL